MTETFVISTSGHESTLGFPIRFREIFYRHSWNTKRLWISHLPTNLQFKSNLCLIPNEKSGFKIDVLRKLDDEFQLYKRMYFTSFCKQASGQGGGRQG